MLLFGHIFDRIFVFSGLWQQLRLLNTTKHWSIFGRSWMNFLYIFFLFSFVSVIISQPPLLAFASFWNINRCKLPHWSLNCNTRPVKLPLIWNSLLIIDYILNITVWMYLLSTLVRVSQWKTAQQKRLMGNAVCLICPCCSKKGHGFDPYSSHTLWLWFHCLEKLGLYM